MPKIELLDCTLRDGSYIVSGDFGEDVIHGLLKKLDAAGVDIIECGWLKDSTFKAGSAYYHLPTDAHPYFPDNRRAGTVYAVMIDWDRYDLANLPPRSSETIDAIRMVFPHGKHVEALSLAPQIIANGYDLYLQAANTLAYTNDELVSLAKAVNEANAVSLSIVDTFGAMYPEDLERIFMVLDRELDSRIKLGFHSHNNQQLSFALTMHFLKLGMTGKRGLVVDASLCGMGRGAGNATTELVANYLNRSFAGNYDMNEILDGIDMYLTQLKEHYEWGYSIPYFIAGVYCTHVNNIAYLRTHHKTLAKDMRIIIESLTPEIRKKYDYDNLERIYTEYQNRAVNDTSTLSKLASELDRRPILILAPGATLKTHAATINDYVVKVKPLVIGVNSAPEGYSCDWYFFQNALRYRYAAETAHEKLTGHTTIVTSNIRDVEAGSQIVNFNLLSKRGWKYFDNAAIMCLRLVVKLGATDIAFAGFDGFPVNSTKLIYANRVLQSELTPEIKQAINSDVLSMLDDFRTCDKSHTKITFITPSLYSEE